MTQLGVLCEAHLDVAAEGILLWWLPCLWTWSAVVLTNFDTKLLGWLVFKGGSC